MHPTFFACLWCCKTTMQAQPDGSGRREGAMDQPQAATETPREERAAADGEPRDKTPRTERGRRTLRKLLDAAAIEFGERGFALMDLSAARMHRALPRALAAAFVASPRRRQRMRLSDRDAVIYFRQRDLDLLHVELMRTDLGDCLVTTPEQTVLDFAHMRHDPAVDADVHAAIRSLLARCDDVAMDQIAGSQGLRHALTNVRRMARER